MLTIPDDELRQWLAEDVPYGDLTTHALGIGNHHGRITFEARQAMVAACSEEAGRIMALAGADVIAHPSNLVFPDAQRIMIGRAFENRVFVVTANRTGTDDRPAGRVRFTGRSQIVDPDGRVLARAGVAETCARGADCDLATARDKALTAITHLFTSRRPAYYRALMATPAWGRTRPRAPRVRGRGRTRTRRTAPAARG